MDTFGNLGAIEKTSGLNNTSCSNFMVQKPTRSALSAILNIIEKNNNTTDMFKCFMSPSISTLCIKGYTRRCRELAF